MPNDNMILSGPDRAAFILLMLGEEHASAVMEHMGPERVRTVGLAMTAMKGLDLDHATEVLDEFLGELSAKKAMGLGDEDYIRSVLKNTLGDEQASIIALSPTTLVHAT